MPSKPSNDEILVAARACLKGGSSTFHAAVAGSVDQVRGALDARRAVVPGVASPLVAEFGAFASGRIDVERLASFAASTATTDEDHASPVLERALSALTAVGLHGDAVETVDLPHGGHLRDAVADALAHVGRAFGAARIAELARTGRYAEAEHGPWLLKGLPFARWTRAERRLAPPLLVQLDGSDLSAGGLAEFLDGGVKILLVVRGAAAPAPLARLVTPGTFVLQTTDVTGLDRFAAHDGCGVAAVMPEGAATFVHDPAGGAFPWERLEVRHRPTDAPRAALGGWSAWQQAEDLRHLASLTERFGSMVLAGAAAGAKAPTGDPVQSLASWLLTQADLSPPAPAPGTAG